MFPAAAGFKFKEGEDLALTVARKRLRRGTTFNRRNTLSILRIALTVARKRLRRGTSCEI